MNYWRTSPCLKLMAYLILGLLVINPAFALTYQQFNRTTDFLKKIPPFQPQAFRIHISQKAEVLALLRRQGYDVIPATKQDAMRFLAGNNPLPSYKPVQLAANFNLHKVYESDCSYKTKYCYREECDKYPKERRKDCPGATAPPPPVSSAGTSTPPDTPPPSTDTGTAEPPTTSPQSPPPSQRSSTHTSVSVSHSGGFHLPNFGGGGGNKGDAAAVMLIVIGVVVIAALFIYAGKWLIDTLSNDEDYYAYWWDIGAQFITLGTEAGQHGDFNGLKFSGGFVANRVTQFGLAAEVGKMDLDVLYNRNSTTPTRVNLKGTYWLVGPTVRWLLGYTDTEQFINNSYIYLELLGGNADRKEVDLLAVARIGFNTALGKHLRLGVHYGAFYLGLKQDQGFANDGNNYWNMYGLELGYQF